MSERFRVVPLDNSHVRRDFHSGSEPLDRYFKEFVKQDVKRRLSNCFVAISDDSNAVAGFYTFSATSVALVDLPGDVRARLPNYGVVPAGLVGRLAVDQRFQGIGLGAALIVDAIERAKRSEAAMFALLVDAKDEKALGFYQRLGFTAFNSRPLSCFLPLRGVATA